jgi:hypothetical protein
MHILNSVVIILSRFRVIVDGGLEWVLDLLTILTHNW